MFAIFKKLILILAIFISITKIGKKTSFIVALSFQVLAFNNFTLPLKHILCIYYLIYFKKNQTKIKALLDSNNKINIMTPTYVAKLDFKIWTTNIGT